MKIRCLSKIPTLAGILDARHELQVMERMFRDNLSNQAGFLAYHFYHSQDWHKALAYTLEAGHIARRSFGCREALMCFDRALDILQKGGWEHVREKALQIYKWKGGLHFCLGQKEKSRSAFYKMYSEAKRLRTVQPAL